MRRGALARTNEFAEECRRFCAKPMLTAALLSVLVSFTCSFFYYSLQLFHNI